MKKLITSLCACVVLLASAAFGQDAKPVKVLIITGDHVAHDWKKTTPVIKDFLGAAKMDVAVTETPAKDLTSDNLAKYDVLLLNYRDSGKGPEETKWSEANKKAFADA